MSVGKIWILFWVFLICLFSCQKQDEVKSKRVSPDEIISRYNDALRWNLYEEAKNFILPQAQAQFEEFVKLNKGKLNIIDYDIISIELSPDGKELTCRIWRSFYTVPSMKQQEQQLDQNWKMVDGIWLLSGPPF